MNTTHVEARRDLKELRISRGKTQADLGSQALVSQYENGHRMPGPHSVTTMATALGVEPQVVYAACEESKRRAEAKPTAPTHANQPTTRGAR